MVNAATIDQEDRIEYKQVLEVDGGGVRGAFAAGVLNLMDEDLKREGKQIHEFFKGGMSGTSTGSFIILALTAPRHKIRAGETEDATHQDWAAGPYTPAEIINFYQEMAEKVFTCFTTENCYQNCCEFPPQDVCRKY